MCFKHILKCQKIPNKNLARTSWYCTCSQSRFAKNRQLMCRVWKRQNLVLQNAFHKTSFCLFYTSHKKCRFSPKLDVHTYNVEMYAPNFCLEFFHTLIYIFSRAGARAPGSTNGFPIVHESIFITYVVEIFNLTWGSRPVLKGIRFANCQQNPKQFTMVYKLKKRKI